MDTGNTSVKVFIIVWRIAEYRGHLDLKIFKIY